MDRGKDRHKNTAKRKEYLRRYHYDYDLRRKYGITLEQFEALLLLQKNYCPICLCPFEDKRKGSGQSVKIPVVDHCHKNNTIRGIICSACNVALGAFSDSPAILRNALAYLESTPIVPKLETSLDADMLLKELLN